MLLELFRGNGVNGLVARDFPLDLQVLGVRLLVLGLLAELLPLVSNHLFQVDS